MKQRDYDSTVARIAGNILSRVLDAQKLRNILSDYDDVRLEVRGAIKVARVIVEETKRTEPKDDTLGVTHLRNTRTADDVEDDHRAIAEEQQ